MYCCFRVYISYDVQYIKMEAVNISEADVKYGLQINTLYTLPIAYDQSINCHVYVVNRSRSLEYVNLCTSV